jgi:hypothetical protein
MGENPKSFNQHLGELAELADKVQNLYKGKATIVFELSTFEFATFKGLLDPNNLNEQEFKIDISGTEFIYLLDASLNDDTTS